MTRRDMGSIQIKISDPNEIGSVKECRIAAIRLGVPFRDVVLEALYLWKMAHKEGLLSEEDDE